MNYSIRKHTALFCAAGLVLSLSGCGAAVSVEKNTVSSTAASSVSADSESASVSAPQPAAANSTAVHSKELTLDEDLDFYSAPDSAASAVSAASAAESILSSAEDAADASLENMFSVAPAETVSGSASAESAVSEAVEAASAAEATSVSTAESVAESIAASSVESTAESTVESAAESVTASAAEIIPAVDDVVTYEPVFFDPTWEYGGNSRINSGIATLYHAKPSIAKHITVCINAGHGTQGGSSVKTLCHPDGTPKVTGGSTAAGATEATAIATGMDFLDGTPESHITLALAQVVRETLINAGYDVLMIREAEDVQLDNIARTLMANNNADCHIALHYDSTDWDKGVYYMSVPSDSSYRSMEPVASHWQDHNRLGDCIIQGMSSEGISIFEGGSMEVDLTQTSYSTVPSIDLEVGDKASDHSGSTYPGLAAGILRGLDLFFAQTASN
ncbi:MAG: N-acetylmuramoyl-L-alanine amidase [Lachnospiraceae bacterium]|nr:N-acetylmuramoyl-L-alanine amidase [Lachnospiraceae bacterium]